MDLRPRPSASKPETPIWKHKWFPMAAVAAGALILGTLIGGSASKTETVEVTKEVPGPVTTVTATPPTITKVQEKTPASCLEYITLSEQGFDYAAEAMGYMSDGMKAAADFDIAGINQANTKLKSVTPKMSALSPKSNAAKAECRASAR